MRTLISLAACLSLWAVAYGGNADSTKRAVAGGVVEALGPQALRA
jgi:hypothetical protein